MPTIDPWVSEQWRDEYIASLYRRDKASSTGGYGGIGERTIFVFGSNTQGRHGKGAALEAMKNWGAEYGNPQGLQGDSYAIVTKELRKDKPAVTLLFIHSGVRDFKSFARSHSEMAFHVTPIGCGLAGFTPEAIAPLFSGCPDNVLLPSEFIRVMDGKRKTPACDRGEKLS